MGRPKALLPDQDGRSFVARLVRTFAAAGIPRIVVVTGSCHDAIVEAVAADAPPAQPLFATNPDPARGQLSSLWIGLDAAAAPDLEAVLMTLVDIPLVQPSTVQRVIETWRATRAPIVRPAIGPRHGHPVLFDRVVIEELRRAPLEEGAKSVVRRHAQEIVNVPVVDEGAVVDIDTPADYERMTGRTVR